MQITISEALLKELLTILTTLDCSSSCHTSARSFEGLGTMKNDGRALCDDFYCLFMIVPVRSGGEKLSGVCRQDLSLTRSEPPRDVSRSFIISIMM
jgi:hypothetical protein